MIRKVANIIAAAVTTAIVGMTLFLLSTFMSSCSSPKVEPNCKSVRDMFGHQVTSCDIVKIRHKGEL